MKIGTKYFLICKNIGKIIEDFEILIKNEEFIGKLDGKYFHFQYDFYTRLASPELKVELLEKDINSTILKIDIVFPLFHIGIILFWLLVLFTTIFKMLILNWSDNNILTNVFFLTVIFSVPIMEIIHFNYTLNNM